MKLSCGIIPIRLNGNQREFLLLRCYKNWDFPKGMMDPGEDPLTTALREFTEETGLQNIKVISPKLYTETEVYSNGKVARYYPAMFTGSSQVQISPNPVTGIIEHHEFGWFTVTEAHQRLVPRLQKVLKWAERKLQEKS